MALITGDEQSQPTNAKAVDCTKQKNTNKAKPVRRKNSSKTTELQVSKSIANKTIISEKTSVISTNCEINTNHQFNLISQGATEIMFYPQCPQCYPITTNEWSPVVQIQCPLYSLQSIPVIVNPPLMSTQICPYPPIVGPLTVANEYQAPPLVLANEFKLHISDGLPIVTSSNAGYCEISPISDLSSGFSNLPSLDPCSSFGTQIPNEVTDELMLNEQSPLFSYVSSKFSSSISDIFKPQMPNEFVSICNSACNEIAPLSICGYESLSFECFQCDLSMNDKKTHEAEVQEYEHYVENPLQLYLSLPKELFPTARMMTIDPNAIIDEFCKVSNLDDYSWIVDLEFGVPKTSVTRRVATYNVKLNSIHCKNVPEAIHPGFEGCDKDLKRALMFYYDCVVSNWYRGYIALSSDRSVENFQSWLLLPMQVLGMCWP